jgi:tetratricopeptide (TPR) repeat protein
MLQANGANENLTAARSAEQQGEWDVAMSEYLRGLEEARAAGNHAKVVKILLALGRVHFERGEYDTANQRFLECLALTRNIGDIAIQPQR